MLELLSILQSDPSQAHAIRRVATLLLILAIFGVVLVTCVAMVFVLRRRRKRGAETRRERSPTERVDAWAEAGRRAPIPSDDDSEDEDEDDEDEDAKDNDEGNTGPSGKTR